MGLGAGVVAGVGFGVGVAVGVGLGLAAASALAGTFEGTSPLPPHQRAATNPDPAITISRKIASTNNCARFEEGFSRGTLTRLNSGRTFSGDSGTVAPVDKLPGASAVVCPAAA